MESSEASYQELLRRGREIYSGVRIGRPGRGIKYWITISLMRFLNLKLSVTVQGAHHVKSGPAILVGNHVNAMDPVVIVMKQWWRVIAFAKVEVFENRGAIFFRWMAQIPLRRGDEESTRWALDMANQCVKEGRKLGLYPEGTRSPDKKSLHKLHRRVLIPILESNPAVPVHTITTVYGGTKFGRREVTVTLSEPLEIDTRTMDPEVIVEMIKDSILKAGGMNYVDAFARDIKRDSLAS